ncbi:MAG TPA: hypothetical protein VG758_24300 [Hyphomicrobiaceae bacterium]|nr:hypothetical protein [Hyphomicrobiaceae bacterium]
MDSCAADYLTERDISSALLSEPVLLAAAKVLSERHGRVVSPGDLRARIEAVLKATDTRAPATGLWVVCEAL